MERLGQGTDTEHPGRDYGYGAPGADYQNGTPESDDEDEVANNCAIDRYGVERCN